MKKIWIIPAFALILAVLAAAGCSSDKSPSSPNGSNNPSAGNNYPSYEFKADGAIFNSVSYSVGAATTWFGTTTSTTCTTSGDIISCLTTTTGPVTYPPWTYTFSVAPGTSYSLQVCPVNSSGTQTVYLYKNGNLENFQVEAGSICPYISGNLP